MNCLYGITNIVERYGITFDGILDEIVSLLPTSWQYPEITCARIILENKEYKTVNFLETKWKQSADIIIHEEIIGEVDIWYLEEKPESDEGPFLKEERDLLVAITERLGRITERFQVENALRETNLSTLP